MTAGTTRDPATVGPYRLIRRLGEGGMGVVHLAVDPAGRAVALKVLRAHVAHDDEARRRLAREVATLRRVRHPLVAEVLDADVAGDQPYLVTRFVPGRSLEDEVRATGPFPAGQVARIGRDLAGALSQIHAVGVVHRDLKPANVMLVDGQPVLIDFGIAHTADESRITRTGLVMGTPGYLSPELIYGEPVTDATDWWAWGATLAFAATGRQPFGTGPIEVVLERVRRGISDLDGVEPALRDLLRRTLTVDPAARPSAAELQAGLDAVIAAVATAPSSLEARQPGHRAGPLDRTARTAPPPTALARPAPPPAAAARTAAAAPRPALQPYPPPPTPPPTPSYRPPPPYPGGQHPSASPALPPYGTPPYRAAQSWQPQQSPHPAVQYPHPAAQPYPPAYQAPQPYPPPPPTTPYSGAASARSGRGANRADAADRADTGPRRVTGVLATAMFTLCLVAAVAPGGALVLAVLFGILARTVERSGSGLERRRMELGRSRTDVAVTVAALPWRLLMAVLTSIVAAILPLLVAASAAFVAGSMTGPDGTPQPTRALPLMIGMAAGLATAWWGPGGAKLRAGTRTIARSVTATHTGQVVVLVGCALVALAVLMVAVQSGSSPDWSPFQPPGALTR